VIQRRGSATVCQEQPVPRAVGWWLAGIAGMSFVAVAFGGLTRLTESGLSMVNEFFRCIIEEAVTIEQYIFDTNAGKTLS